MNTRREFMKKLIVGGISVPLMKFSLTASSDGNPRKTPLAHPIRQLFPDFKDLTPEAKIRHIEQLTSAARAHPSGIFVCMPKITAEGMRQVRVSDFDGMDQFSEAFGMKFKSITDFFDNENSITVSGSHLAAQSVRYAASGDPAALAAARKAYASLRIIFQFGTEAGRPGFMGKPYHFEYSDHTTGDQYLHMLWGLWSFYPIASAKDQAEIRDMLVAMADYQIKVDYTIFNRTGGNWNMRLDPTDYNAIMAALVAAAYRMSGDRKYRDAYAFVVQTGKWQTHQRIDDIIEQFRNGTYKPKPWDRIAGAEVEAGEFAHWEQIQHCQFTAISAAIIHECVPDLFTSDDLSRVVGLWWEDNVMGFDREYWGYLYWFLVSSQDRTWRPCPRTERVPREQWFGGHPMLSFASSWIYGDCLARFQWTAMVVARHCPPKRDEAVAFASETLRRLQPHHMLWIADPDGEQIPTELRYFTEILSSEVPECLIASYWEGRRLNLWS